MHSEAAVHPLPGQQQALQPAPGAPTPAEPEDAVDRVQLPAVPARGGVRAQPAQDAARGLQRPARPPSAAAGPAGAAHHLALRQPALRVPARAPGHALPRGDRRGSQFHPLLPQPCPPARPEAGDLRPQPLQERAQSGQRGAQGGQMVRGDPRAPQAIGGGDRYHTGREATATSCRQGRARRRALLMLSCPFWPRGQRTATAAQPLPLPCFLVFREHHTAWQS